ncbi:MAG: glutamine--fructose-6-phosphate transaminase (isomerizing) [Candidatus Wallbacteria bacterium]|nr:glutamine--fructose-6-phosphate transaminase (isomerizing) [Candidatus Wallbacteria bacterium]
MCGIVGYIGEKNAVPILLEGLSKLEYRGYDSAGISFLDESTGSGQLKVIKREGRLSVLESAIPEGTSARLGIGHTRWATHGVPSFVNAHPHFDCTHEIVLVHNGIIENYRELKEKLLAGGHVFTSETDTEVIAHLIEEYYEEDIEFAVKAALNEVKGAYAIAALSLRERDRIIAARMGSPLIIGLGEGENFLASDIPAVLKYTRRIIFLDEREVAVITKDEVHISTFRNTRVEREPVTITWDETMAAKDGYEHFMLKEILEQPRALQQTISQYVCPDGKFSFEHMDLGEDTARELNRVFIIACGTSLHAGMVGKYWIEQFCGIPVEVDYASEFRYRSPLISERDLAVVISQSGETADTLAALRLSAERTKHTLGIVNVLGSTITREARHTIYTHAGPEIGVASTKAFTTQLAALLILSLHLGKLRGSIGRHELTLHQKQLSDLPQLLETALSMQERIEETAKSLAGYSDFLFLGRNMNFPIALEGALKLKEISYLHAEAYPAGEMKHGPIALIDERMPTIAVATGSHVQEKMFSNIQEIKARRGLVAGIINTGDSKAREIMDFCLEVPETQEYLMPLLNIIPMQLLAYYIARDRGCDIDKPRNLAKSVTVE